MCADHGTFTISDTRQINNIILHKCVGGLFNLQNRSEQLSHSVKFWALAAIAFRHRSDFTTQKCRIRLLCIHYIIVVVRRSFHHSAAWL